MQALLHKSDVHIIFSTGTYYNFVQYCVTPQCAKSCMNSSNFGTKVGSAMGVAPTQQLRMI